jgi:hypothetical protein
MDNTIEFNAKIFIRRVTATYNKFNSLSFALDRYRVIRGPNNRRTGQ